MDLQVLWGDLPWSLEVKFIFVRWKPGAKVIAGQLGSLISCLRRSGHVLNIS